MCESYDAHAGGRTPAARHRIWTRRFGVQRNRHIEIRLTPAFALISRKQLTTAIVIDIDKLIRHKTRKIIVFRSTDRQSAA